MSKLSSDFGSIIVNPLEWQNDIDLHGLGVNMRGSARFWSTVSHCGLQVIYRDGAPDFREIAFQIDEQYALVLWSDKGIDNFAEDDTNIHDQYFHCKVVELLIPEKEWQRPYDLKKEVNLDMDYISHVLNVTTTLSGKFSVVTFKLTDNVGLQLDITTSSPYIHFRFVQILK